jgi:hypothetical protein
MALTAVLQEGKFVKTIDGSAEAKKEFEGQEGVEFVTKKSFKASDDHKSWDEMIGKAKPIEESEEKVAKTPRTAAVVLSGPYHLLKPLPATPADHPKMPIWNAIVENSGKTCEEAIADCPKENPKRKTNGVYTFASEFRYFLKAGYVAMGETPEGFDYTKYEKPVKAKKESADSSAKNESAEGASA